MLTTDQITELRESLEVQFRYKFYTDMRFPYMQSLGVDHVFQSFEHNGQPIGVLHLWYDTTKELTEENIWRSEWIDSALEAIRHAQMVSEARMYDENLVVHANLDYIQSKYGDPSQQLVGMLI